MINRKEEIMKLAERVFPDQFLESSRQIALLCEKNCSDVIRTFLESFRCVLEQTAELQKKREKGDVKYVLFSCLHSSIFLKRYLIRIDMMDKRFYNDTAQAHSYWNADILYSLFETDVESIAERIRWCVPRLREYETDYIRYAYAPYYHRLAKTFLKAVLETALEDGDFLPGYVSREGTIPILFGEYMGRADTLYVLRKCGGEEE